MLHGAPHSSSVASGGTVNAEQPSTHSPAVAAVGATGSPAPSSPDAYGMPTQADWQAPAQRDEVVDLLSDSGSSRNSTPIGARANAAAANHAATTPTATPATVPTRSPRRSSFDAVRLPGAAAIGTSPQLAHQQSDQGAILRASRAQAQAMADAATHAIRCLSTSESDSDSFIARDSPLLPAPALVSSDEDDDTESSSFIARIAAKAPTGRHQQVQRAALPLCVESSSDDGQASSSDDSIALLCEIARTDTAAARRAPVAAAAAQARSRQSRAACQPTALDSDFLGSTELSDTDSDGSLFDNELPRPRPIKGWPNSQLPHFLPIAALEAGLRLPSHANDGTEPRRGYFDFAAMAPHARSSRRVKLNTEADVRAALAARRKKLDAKLAGGGRKSGQKARRAAHKSRSKSKGRAFSRRSKRGKSSKKGSAAPAASSGLAPVPLAPMPGTKRARSTSRQVQAASASSVARQPGAAPRGFHVVQGGSIGGRPDNGARQPVAELSTTSNMATLQWEYAGGAVYG